MVDDTSGEAVSDEMLAKMEGIDEEQSSEQTAEQAAEQYNARKTTRKGLGADLQFPSASLDRAIAFAMEVFREGGSPDFVQVADALKFSPTGGTFITHKAATGAFGLIIAKKNKISLTPLGQRITQTDKSPQAKIDAFLSVKLFRTIYNYYKGGELPPVGGIEKYMISLGLTQKAAEHGRDIFLKSAKSAGLFDRDERRLVLPRGTTDSGSPSEAIEEQPEERKEPPDEQSGRSQNLGGQNKPRVSVTLCWKA